MDISEELNAMHVTVDEVEPFLELTPALVQKRRSQGRIIFDRFIGLSVRYSRKDTYHRTVKVAADHFPLPKTRRVE